MEENNKRALTICILKILNEYSDENHLLTQQDIIDKLYKLYNITCERKAVANNIQCLGDGGYMIEQTTKGCYLSVRDFEDSELNLLIDNIVYSKYIKKKYARDLLCKLLNKSSISFRKNYDLGVLEDVDRENNSEYFYNISLLQEAITQHNYIEFRLKKYNTNKELITQDYKIVFCPGRLIFKEGRYSVVGMIGRDDIYKKLCVYPIDRMADINIIDKKLQNYQIISFGVKVRDYILSNMQNYDDEFIDFEIKINQNILDEVIDIFGKSVLIEEDNEKLRNKKYNIKLNSTFSKLLNFVLLHKEDVEIIKPQEMRAKMTEIGDSLTNQYYKTDEDLFFAEINHYLKSRQHKWYDDAFYGSEDYFKELNFDNIDLNKFEEYKDCNDADSISFEMTSLDNFSFLKDFIDLRSLDISWTRESDFSFLKNLKILRKLVINHTDIENINFVEQLTNLELLQLYGNNELKNIEALYNNSNIKYLLIDEKLFKGIDIKRLKIKNPKIDVKVINDTNEHQNIDLHIEIDTFAKINKEEMPYEYLTLIFGQRFENMDKSKRNIMIRLINRRYKEFIEKLNQIKEKLKGNQKEIFEDIFFNSLSIQEICNKMDIDCDKFLSIYKELLKNLRNPKLSDAMKEFVLKDNFIEDIDNDDLDSITKFDANEIDLEWLFKGAHMFDYVCNNIIIKDKKLFDCKSDNNKSKIIEVDKISKPTISVCYIQKTFSLGYPRAAKIFDYMLEKGVIEEVLYQGKSYHLINIPKEEINNYLLSLLEKIK